MFCAKCGNKLEDGARFCNECGNVVESPMPVMSQPNVSVKKPLGKAPLVIGICASVAVLTIFAIVVIAKIVFDTKEADAANDRAIAIIAIRILQKRMRILPMLMRMHRRKKTKMQKN